MSQILYDDQVFVNCPFDEEYKELFDAIIFTVHDCGFVARSALELDNASQIRIEKIVRIIKSCRLGIHDISRTELSKEELPRFNMPLEIGLFLGVAWAGNSKQSKKNCLILDRDKFRYQKFCSDIAGQDIKAHNGRTEDLIKEVRNWLASARRAVVLPSGGIINNRYKEFLQELPTLCQSLLLDPNELIFNDFTTLVSRWLEVNSQWSK